MGGVSTKPARGMCAKGFRENSFCETHLLFANQMVNGPEEVFVRGTQRTVMRIASPQSQGCASTCRGAACVPSSSVVACTLPPGAAMLP